MVEVNKIQLLMRHLARPLRSSGSPLKSDSGQAIIEYILVLVVTLGIILGVMYQFNNAFKKYVQSYFGEYVACLLETGELPTLGGTAGANAETCDASFEKFSLKDGRPFISSDGSNSESGSGSGSGRTSRSTPRSRNANLQKSKVTSNNRGRNGEATSGSSDSKASDDSKKRIIRRTVSNPNYNFRANRQRDRGQIPLASTWNMSKEKKEEQPFTAKIDAKNVKNGGSRGGRKIAVNMDKFKIKRAGLTDAGLNLSLGDYVRYLIIGFIIILIIIFFGGQLMQIKKNYEAS